MAFIPKPPFPNVPKLPGVPQLVRSPILPASPGPVIGTAAALGALWRALLVKNGWGIYQAQKDAQGRYSDETRVVVPDSFLEFGFRNSSEVSDYPIQDGAFTNYDKVANPYELYVRMSKGGSKEDRRIFLDSIEAIANTLDLYDILTPEKAYRNVNVTRFEVTRRGPGGAYFLTEVDVFFREIRTVTAQYTTTSVTTRNAQDPSAEPVTNRGTINGERPAVEPDLDGVVNK